MVNVLVINALTGEQIERTETSNEKAIRDTTHAEKLANSDAREKAKQAVLDKLGLTDAEASALLG